MSSGDSSTSAIVPELLTTCEAARLTGMGERTIWRHSRSGLAPAPIRIGGLIRYRRAELLDWIAGGCRPVTSSTPKRSGGAR